MSSNKMAENTNSGSSMEARPVETTEKKRTRPAANPNIIGTDLKAPVHFMVSIVVENANANGDPARDGQPRVDINGIGEISRGALIRKMRNARQRAGGTILLQESSKREDECLSVQERIVAYGMSPGGNIGELRKEVLETFEDIPTYGTLLALSSGGNKKKRKKRVEEEEEEGSSLSLGIAGAISISPAFSAEPVRVVNTQITKSFNTDKGLEEGERESSSMGCKSRVEHGVYTAFGSVLPFNAKYNGVCYAHLEKLKRDILTMFEGDYSGERPAGSIYVRDVAWWDMRDKPMEYQTARIAKSMGVDPKTGEMFVKDAELAAAGVVPERLDTGWGGPKKFEVKTPN